MRTRRTIATMSSPRDDRTTTTQRHDMSRWHLLMRRARCRTAFEAPRGRGGASFFLRKSKRAHSNVPAPAQNFSGGWVTFQEGGNGGGAARRCMHAVAWVYARRKRIVRFSRCFFTFVFPPHVGSPVLPVPLARRWSIKARRSVAVALENFSGRLLTVKKSVIRFRPADLSCGSE